MTTGTVSSGNLTSLYSNTTSFTAGVVNSSVYSVNGGLGVTVNPITGNVVVSIGQDVSTSSNVQFANVKATGNLSNNYYTLANALGTIGQVLTTNGAGTTSWTTPSTLGLVNSVSGSGAGISVSPTTGAVVVSNTGVTSIVAGSNISISGGTGAVTINAVGFGTGNVSGPASATDNAIARYDLTTGKLIQNSTVIIADNGNLGINTINPLYELTVNAGGDGYCQIGMENAERTWLVTNDDSVDLITYAIIPSGGSPINRLQFNATTGHQWFPSGRLGVNNSAPALELDVTGTGQFSADLIVNGGNITTNVGAGASANLYNSNAIGTINIGNGVVTEVNIGNVSSGRVFAKTPSFETYSNAIIGGDLAVSGGDITTTFGTGNLFNANALVVNVGNGATTEVNLGNTGAGRVQIKSPEIVGANTTQAVFNTVATTVNAFGAATTTNIGSTVSGTTTIGYDLVVNNNLSASQVTIDNLATINTQTTTTTSLTPTSISSTTRLSQKAMIRIIDNVSGEIHMLEALAFYKGTTAYLTTYAEMYTSAALATFTADVSAGAIRILATPASTNLTTFTVVRTSLS
jgi:hypothetical protein